MLIVFSLVMLGCAEHPLLSPDSLKAALDVASPYVYSECKEVSICPMYELNYGQGIDQSEHGYGGIVGGCGKYIKITCFANEAGTVCEEVEKLEKVLTFE
jgi:hypothetical protein